MEVQECRHTGALSVCYCTITISQQNQDGPLRPFLSRNYLTCLPSLVES